MLISFKPLSTQTKGPDKMIIYGMIVGQNFLFPLIKHYSVAPTTKIIKVITFTSI